MEEVEYDEDGTIPTIKEKVDRKIQDIEKFNHEHSNSDNNIRNENYKDMNMKEKSCHINDNIHDTTDRPIIVIKRRKIQENKENEGKNDENIAIKKVEINFAEYASEKPSTEDTSDMNMSSQGNVLFTSENTSKNYETQQKAPESIFIQQPSEISYECRHCEYSAVDMSLLKQHVTTHHFTCNLCDFSSSRETKLQNHVRIHTGEKPFKCTYCDYAAAQEINLKTHLRTHTGERPFSCTFCDYKASQKSTMECHTRSIHTGEKPYKCSECDFAAAQRAHLNKHIKKHAN